MEELWADARGPDCCSPTSPKICPQGSIEHINVALNAGVVGLGQDRDLLATTLHHLNPNRPPSAPG